MKIDINIFKLNLFKRFKVQWKLYTHRQICNFVNIHVLAGIFCK